MANALQSLSTRLLRGHRVRIVFVHDARAATYKPEVHVYLAGPNGSASGWGPKAWPLQERLRRRRDGSYRRSWSSGLTVPIPHVTWRAGYRLRRVGGLRAYRLVYRATRCLCGGRSRAFEIGRRPEVTA